MKAVKIIVLLVVLAIIGVLVYTALNAGSLVKQAIESVGPQYLGTSVKLDKVDLSLTEGTAAVTGLTIGNPTGYKGAYAMQFGLIKVVLNPADVTSDPIVLQQVVIDGAKIAAVVKGAKDTNFTAIVDHLSRTVGAPDTAESDDSEEIRVIINRLDFTDLVASVSSDILGDAELKLPDIHLRDIGRKSNGATLGEVAQQLLKPINQAVAKELIKKQLGTDQLKSSLEEKLKSKLSDKLKDLGRFGHPDS